MVFNYTDYLDETISLWLQLLEATRWDLAYLDSNAHRQQGEYAIMTEANIPENGHVNVPFFSMTNAVITLRELKEQLNYQDARMMFNPSSAPLSHVNNIT